MSLRRQGQLCAAIALAIAVTLPPVCASAQTAATTKQGAKAKPKTAAQKCKGSGCATATRAPAGTIKPTGNSNADRVY